MNRYRAGQSSDSLVSRVTAQSSVIDSQCPLPLVPDLLSIIVISCPLSPVSVRYLLLSLFTRHWTSGTTSDLLSLISRSLSLIPGLSLFCSDTAGSVEPAERDALQPHQWRHRQALQVCQYEPHWLLSDHTPTGCRYTSMNHTGNYQTTLLQAAGMSVWTTLALIRPHSYRLQVYQSALYHN